MELPELISAVGHHDNRGVLHAFSAFDLKEIVRMYVIEPANLHVVRAWQGHQQERKWFLATAGKFEVQTIPLGENGMPKIGARMNWVLKASEPTVLAIPGSYLNGFRAMEAYSKLLVFSDFHLEASKADDIRFSLEEIPWRE